MEISSIVCMSLTSLPLITLSSKTTQSRFISFFLLTLFSSFQILHLSFCILSSPFCWCFQMRPTYHPEGLFDENKVASQKTKTPSTAQLWHQNGRCPEDTIPIRRTTRDDVLRASSVKRYGRKKHRSIPCPLSVDPDLLNESGHQVWCRKATKKPYFGAKVASFLDLLLVPGSWLLFLLGVSWVACDCLCRGR